MIGRASAIILMGGLLTACAATPEPDGPPKPHPVGVVRQEFENCVAAASRADFLANREAHMAVERGFQACATEEQALYAIGSISGIRPLQMAQMVSALKLRMKRELTPR